MRTFIIVLNFFHATRIDLVISSCTFRNRRLDQSQSSMDFSYVHQNSFVKSTLNKHRETVGNISPSYTVAKTSTNKCR